MPQNAGSNEFGCITLQGNFQADGNSCGRGAINPSWNECAVTTVGL